MRKHSVASSFDGPLLHSTLGTPTEEVWPGVGSLPDYKATFPRWNGMPLSKAVPALDGQGIELLRSMLVYDPAGRISGELFALACCEVRHVDMAGAPLRSQAMLGSRILSQPKRRRSRIERLCISHTVSSVSPL